MNVPRLDLMPQLELEELLPKSALGKIEKYNEGYECGLTWPDAWDSHGKPGGPWIYTANHCGCRTGCDRQTSPRFTCRQSIDFARQSREENDLWRRGWEAGHAEKARTGRKNGPRT